MNSHNTPITSLSVTIAPSQDREDTTEVAQLRAVLTQLEARWSATFDQVAVGIAHIALDGHCLWINQRLCSILGYRAEELASKTIAALIVPEDWNNNVKAAQQLIAGETQSYLLNERYRHKNGSTIWGRRTLSLARTSEGTPDYFIAVIEDITALKLAEDALRASEERYRRVVNDQADLICRFRPDFCLTFVNQAYAESVGKTPAELIGSNVLDLIPLEHQADVINHLPIQNPTGHAATMENPIWSADGALRWFEWTDRAIVDEQGAVIEYQAVGRDITARRQAEEAERRQRQFTEALLGSLAALTTSLDVEQVMPHILASATTVVPSDAGSIILFEEGYYRIAYCRGFSPEVATLLQQQRFAIDTWPNIRATLTHKMAYIAVDTQQTAEWGEFPLTAWIRSSIGVPIILGGEMIGLLIADSATPNYFSTADVDKLRAFAHYASLALANAYQATRLEEQVATRTAELQAAKERIETIFNHSSDAILLVQPDLQIVQSNTMFATLLCHQPGEEQRHSLLDYIHPDDAMIVSDGMGLAMSQGGNHQIQVRAYRRDGSHFDAELSLSPMDTTGLVCTLRNITERKARERQLQFFASLQESVNEAVFTLGLDYSIHSWNKAAETIYGWQATEVSGQKAFEILNTLYFHPDTRETVRQQLFAQGRWQGEVMQARKDGTLVHISGSLTLLRDAQQIPYGAVAVLHDITEQKRMEVALQESRHFVEQIADTAPSIIFVYDFQAQQTVYINRKITTVLGYLLEEFQTLRPNLLTMLMHPDDAAHFPAHLEQLLAGQDGAVFPFEYRMRHKNGDWRWFLGQDTIFQRQNDDVVSQFLSVATDITEQKLAAEALRRQRDFLQHLIDHVPALISVKDRLGRYQLVNQRSAQIFSIKAAEMVGRTDAELNPNRGEVAFFRQKDQEALASGQAVFIPEQTILGAYYQTNKVPLTNERGELDRLLIVSVDISTHKQAEIKLKQALQAEKELNEHKSGFITTTSHEFRTPLAAILSLTETLMAYRDRLTDTQIAERLVKIQQQVERLKTLMTDVLELERMQTRRMNFTPVELDLSTFCRELMIEFQSLFSVNQRLIYQEEGVIPAVKLDKRLLHHIVTNLLSNAIKYSPRESTVRLTLGYTAGMLSLRVQDQGIGIPAVDLKHLFQPFYRATNAGTIHGTGLGLSITKEAAALHGGTIMVDSELGVGTTFTVQIPIP